MKKRKILQVDPANSLDVVSGRRQHFDWLVLFNIKYNMLYASPNKYVSYTYKNDNARNMHWLCEKDSS
jgi:hypothetical protein